MFLSLGCALSGTTNRIQQRSPGTFDPLWTLYNRGLLTEYSSRWIAITTGGDYTLEPGLELEVKGSARTSLGGNLPDGSITRVWATTLNEYYDALADPVTGRLALKLTIDGVACTFTLINMVDPATLNASFPYTFPFVME